MRTGLDEADQLVFFPLGCYTYYTLSPVVLLLSVRDWLVKLGIEKSVELGLRSLS